MRMRIAVSKGRSRAGLRRGEWWCGREGKEGENAHGKCQRATLISVGAEGAVLGEAVVKVRRDQDQAWRFNGDGGESGQDARSNA
jgi:hypothetical protein